MKQVFLRSSTLALVLLLAACASGPAQQAQNYPEPVFAKERIVPDEFESVYSAYDPWEPMNRRIYNFNYHFDQWVFLPVVRGYEWVVPGIARTGIHNFFRNLRDVRTMANSILQLSPRKFFESTGRVLVNSTIGLLGFIDVATSMEIPRPEEDFGQTLGRWGVGKGPFLVLPLLGPSNLRDGIGLIPDLYLNNALKEEFMADDLILPVSVLDALDSRVNTSFRYYETGSAFEYDTVRWLYLTKRQLDVAK